MLWKPARQFACQSAPDGTIASRDPFLHFANAGQNGLVFI
jgi:hypothetical protein